MSISIKALRVPIKLKVEKNFRGISDITLVQMGEITINGTVVNALTDDIIYDYLDQAIYILVAGAAPEDVVFSGTWKIRVTLVNGTDFIVPLECMGDSDSPESAFVEDNLVIGHYYAT